MKADEFLCVGCREIFKKGLSEDQALKDLHKTFPGVKPEDCGLLCDPCYKEFLEWQATVI